MVKKEIIKENNNKKKQNNKNTLPCFLRKNIFKEYEYTGIEIKAWREGKKRHTKSMKGGEKERHTQLSGTSAHTVIIILYKICPFFLELWDCIFGFIYDHSTQFKSDHPLIPLSDFSPTQLYPIIIFLRQPQFSKHLHKTESLLLCLVLLLTLARFKLRSSMKFSISFLWNKFPAVYKILPTHL